MGEEGVSEAEQPEDFEARRAHGKAVADHLRAACESAGKPLGWFDAVYRGAEGDPAMVPWGHQKVRPELAEWLAALPDDAPRGRVLDVGAGLGDNANALAAAGFAVTAFDISGEAVEWAAQRFPHANIEWAVHNLLAPPPEAWRAAFDLVCEVYTLQALRPAMRARAIMRLPEFVKPGGHLLVITKASDAPPDGDTPPWPLQRHELDVLGEVLEEVRFEYLAAEGGGSPHFRALYRKAPDMAG
jgi:SAM-dependent methyltransferase